MSDRYQQLVEELINAEQEMVEWGTTAPHYDDLRNFCAAIRAELNRLDHE